MTTVMQDTTFGGNWAKGIRELNVLFLTSTCEFMIISKKTKLMQGKGLGSVGLEGRQQCYIGRSK